MLNRFALVHGLSFALVDHGVELVFLLVLALMLAGVWRLRKPVRWWVGGTVICAALRVAVPWVLHPVWGPWPSMNDGPAEAARLRITLRTARRVGPFLFPAGAVLQYWTEARDELDWVELPGPSAVVPGVMLIGHMSQWHAVSGWTVHLAQDERVSGEPCAMKAEVVLNPVNGHLMGCDLTVPTRIKGWLCSSVWFETDDRLRSCGADPEQITLPSGVYPAGSGWGTYDEKAESAAVEAGQRLTLSEPAIGWVIRERVEVEFLHDGRDIDRVRTSLGERVPVRGTVLGDVIEWEYKGLEDHVKRYDYGPPRAVRALRGKLSAPLRCAEGELSVGTEVEIPMQGEEVRRWPAESEWTSLKDADAVLERGCALSG